MYSLTVLNDSLSETLYTYNIPCNVQNTILNLKSCHTLICQTPCTHIISPVMYKIPYLILNLKSVHTLTQSNVHPGSIAV
jgi:hypothetical protein